MIDVGIRKRLQVIMPFKVVSFYTAGNGYDVEAKALKESLDAFDISHEIECLPDLGSWHLNTLQKPLFIRKKLLESGHKDIVWLDADAVLQSYPLFFDWIKTDVALYFRTTGPAAKRFGGYEIISAAMYFRRSEWAVKLLDMWIEESHRENADHQLVEQRSLQRVFPVWIKEHCGTVTPLPQSYCRIFDAPEDTRVIVQNQASRRLANGCR